MKVAKADKEEFDKVYNFINIMNTLFDGSFFSNEECWRDWDDDDKDKKLLLEIEQYLKNTEDEPVDNRLILYYFIKRKWKEADYYGSFGRIVTDADVLIDNVCDPDLDYLEYNKEIKQALEKYNNTNNETNEK